MTTMEILWVALGSGTIGAGLMKIFDRLVAHGLAKKDKQAAQRVIDLCAMQKDMTSCKERLDALEEESVRRGKSEQASLKALNALLSHAMTGNATGAMKQAQADLVDSIIDNH